MKVLFYIPSMDKSWGGAMHYAEGVLSSLAQYMAQNKGDICLYVYHNKREPQVLQLADKYPQYVKILSDKDIHFPFLYRIREGLSKVASHFLSNVKAKPYLQRVVEFYGIDLVYSPYQSIPEVDGLPLVLTHHDVQEFHFPEFFSPEQRIQRAIDNNKNLNRATKIFVSFQHVKADLIKYFNLSEDKVVVLPLPLKNLWISDVHLSEEESMNFEKEYTFPRFFLYPAATWKHKNHIALIKAIAQIKRQSGQDVYLYCTGHLTDYGRESLLPQLKAEGLEDNIRFLGSVPKEALLWLYKHAHCVIVPSLYEAGSFPVIESIFLDTPALCSNVTSLPDTVGMSELVFDPEHEIDIAEKMLLMLNDKSFYEEVKLHLAERKKVLQAAEPAPGIIDTYHKVLDL